MVSLLLHCNRIANMAMREIQWSKPKQKVGLEKNGNWSYYAENCLEYSLKAESPKRQRRA